jgi:hypothetical protein
VRKRAAQPAGGAGILPASKPKGFCFPGLGGAKPLCVSAAQKAFGMARRGVKVERLARARSLLAMPVPKEPPPAGPESWQDTYRRLLGREPLLCPACQVGELFTQSRQRVARAATSRSRLREQPCTFARCAPLRCGKG